MELYARELEDKDRKRRLAERKKLEHANRAKTKHNNSEKLKLTELKGALNNCLKATESEQLISAFKTKKDVEDRLLQFPQPWWTYIPDIRDEVKPANPVEESEQPDENEQHNEVEPNQGEYEKDAETWVGIRPGIIDA